MGIVLAVIFLAVAIASLAAYAGTPHVATASTCSPISAFGHVFTIHTNCQYISTGEVVVAAAFFVLAVLAALSARPRG